MALSCLIVDDNVSFLQAARSMLEQQRLSVPAVATSAIEGLERADELRPDVVLVDVRLGDDSGLVLARRIARSTGPPAPAVILISSYPEEEFLDLLDESPAVGFLAKSDLSADAIRALLADRGASSAR